MIRNTVTSLMPSPLLTAIRTARKRYRDHHARQVLWRRLAPLAGQRKAFLAITPPPRLVNVGDHAQVVAIRAWLARHWPEFPVIELDKDETIVGYDLLRRIATPNDLIFLQSGGNLGDRGIWSEAGRRLMIEEFPDLPIVSLPQTIYWSDTPRGQAERQRTREVYRRHPRLTVVARDHVSAGLAAELSSSVLEAPDFALTLSPPPIVPKNDRGTQRVLLVLRRDNESVILGQHEKLSEV